MKDKTAQSLIHRTPQDYADIVDTPWPQSSLRPHMPLKDRAKIFLPFAALKGYEESLEKIQEEALEEIKQRTTPDDN